MVKIVKKTADIVSECYARTYQVNPFKSFAGEVDVAASISRSKCRDDIAKAK